MGRRCVFNSYKHDYHKLDKGNHYSLQTHGLGGYAAEASVVLTNKKGFAAKSCIYKPNKWDSKQVLASDDSDDDPFYSDSEELLHVDPEEYWCYDAADQQPHGAAYPEGYSYEDAMNNGAAAGMDEGCMEADDLAAAAPAAAAPGQQTPGALADADASTSHSNNTAEDMHWTAVDDTQAADALGEAVLAELEHQLGLRQASLRTGSDAEAQADALLSGDVDMTTSPTHATDRAVNVEPPGPVSAAPTCINLGFLIDQALARHLHQLEAEAELRALAEWSLLTPQPSTPADVPALAPALAAAPAHAAPAPHPFPALPLTNTMASPGHVIGPLLPGEGNEEAQHGFAPPGAAPAAAGSAPADANATAGGLLTRVARMFFAQATQERVLARRVVSPFAAQQEAGVDSGEEEVQEDGFVVV
mmetsp:Transcript_28453/g.72396  ORF Transcript_28453/g.72396 Transcript_28453/m.72396 type:complete len:417 (+) Transcript_28453:113-1363(+)